MMNSNMSIDRCESIDDLIVTDVDLRSVGVDIYDLYSVMMFILENIQSGKFYNDIKSALALAVIWLDGKY